MWDSECGTVNVDSECGTVNVDCEYVNVGCAALMDHTHTHTHRDEQLDSAAVQSTEQDKCHPECYFTVVLSAPLLYDSHICTVSS
jgi:hypothetical protein